MSEVIALASDAGDATLAQISTPGLGDHSYVVTVNDLAVVVDPQRDHGRFSDVVADTGSTLVAVFETHIHNDYVSGGLRLAARFGADYVLPRDSGASIPHVAVGGRDIYELGQWRIEAIHTPGHTPHHLAYALIDPTGVRAVFTGGSMLVGAVGRSDLVAPELTDQLTRAQHESVRTLAFELPEHVVVGPTHGAGSFCTASAAGAATSTIAAERRDNPAVLIDDVDEFVVTQRIGARRYPAYYEYMAPINRSGTDDIPDTPLAILDLDDLDAAIAEGAVVVDLRPATEFGAGAIPGSINIPMSDDVATYAAWVIGWGIPLVFVGSSDDAAQARLQLARIGHDEVVGAIIDGLAAWQEADRPLQTFRVTDVATLEDEAPALVLDVRDPVEVRDGAVAGSLNVYVADVARRLNDIPNGDPWVYCASGYRAAIASSVLAALGRQPTLIIGSPAP